jgi:hypothetical protein
MKVDTPAATQQHQIQEAETKKEVQAEITEAALEVNGTTQNPEVAVELDGSQTTISGQPVGDTTE